MNLMFKNGTAYKIQYIYNIENSSSSDNRALTFMMVY